MADDQTYGDYGEPGYFDPSSGATNDYYPSESLGLEGTDTDVNTATDPFTDEYGDYGGDAAGYEGGDVGAAGIPGVSSYGPGSPARPALFDRWMSNAPNLGTSPPTYALPGAAAAARGGAMSRYGAIMRRVAQTTGMRVRLATVLFLIAKIGWAAAAAATGLGAQDLLWLFVRSKTRRRGARGPHLHTIVKRCRQAARYRAMLSRTAQQCGYGHGGGRRHHRRAPPYRALGHHRRRRK
ncbi:MAG TPA: hypothetical protein VK132_07515 [Gemmatimonadales bacterium]|nr:hypothetical protein [Gemmatimonadales bacterium]